MKKLTDYIKHHAIELAISLFKERCGIIELYDRTESDAFISSLSEYLPVFSHSGVIGRIDSLETSSYASREGEYYTVGSFFRFSIVYSGRLDDGQWFFRNATAHFDRNMKFISLQGHHNQSDNGWDLFDQLTMVVANFENITIHELVEGD